jgi:hypothetical protein
VSVRVAKVFTSPAQRSGDWSILDTVCLFGCPKIPKIPFGAPHISSRFVVLLAQGAPYCERHRVGGTKWEAARAGIWVGSPWTECQCVSVSVCHCVIVSVCQCVSVSVCQCVSLSVCQCVSVSVCQYTAHCGGQ